MAHGSSSVGLHERHPMAVVVVAQKLRCLTGLWELGDDACLPTMQIWRVLVLVRTHGFYEGPATADIHDSVCRARREATCL